MRTEILSTSVNLLSENLKNHLLEWSFNEENLKELKENLKLEQEEHNYPDDVVNDLIIEIDEILMEEENLLDLNT